MRKKHPPLFNTEAEEDAFWQTHDSTDYIPWTSAASAVFPNLKPSTHTISLRLPAHLLDALKVMANKRDVPYQSLMKILLEEKISEERQQNGKWRGDDFPALPR